MLSAAQVRAARALLGWSQEQLAMHSKVAKPTIASFESTKRTANQTTLSKIRNTFERVGIQFLENDGVRRRDGIVRTFSGKDAMQNYFLHFLSLFQKYRYDVYVNNANEKGYDKYLSREFKEHYREQILRHRRARKFQIIVGKGETFLPASEYAEYRMTDEHQDIPFLVFGPFMSIVVFSDEPIIFLIKNESAANLYRGYFNVLWEKSEGILS